MSTKNIHREVDVQSGRDAALRWANEMRADRGMEPLDKLPKGQQGKPQACPLARATGLSVSTGAYDRQTGEDFVLPFGVGLFIRDFDGGLHPDLIEDGS